MKHKFEIFSPKDASDVLWDKYYSHHIAIHQEIFPDDPLPSKEMIVKSILNTDPNYDVYRWIVLNSDNNTIIGSGKLEFHNTSSPAYEANKTNTFTELSVRKEYRRKGIGSGLVKFMLSKAQEEGKKIFQSWGLLGLSSGFFEYYGGVIASKEEESRLKISEIDWEMIEEWRKEGPQRATNVTLDRFIDVSDKDITEFCEIYTELLNQIPKEDIEWEAKVTPKDRRALEKRRHKIGIIWTTILSREVDGIISGLTETIYYPDQPTIIFQGLTGVKAKYRGRGLGKWLKAEMLHHIKENLPEVDTIATDFAFINEPMIAINRRMGFKPSNTWLGYKFKISRLLSTLNNYGEN